MGKTALIILAAVVILIVIVVLTGMRYLRADDEDDYDGLPADSGRSLADDMPAGRGRARRGGDDRGWPQANGQARDARMPADRTAHGRTAHGRTVRGSQPQRPGRPARPGRDDVDEQGPVGRRTRRMPDERTGQRAFSDAGNRPARPAVSSREYEDRDGHGTRSAGSPRDQAIRAGRDDLARRGSSRGNSRPDDRDRRNDGAQSRRNESLPAVRPRQGRGKRDGDGEWPSNEWDELSDVDYWAELASDRPLTTTAQPAAPSERPGRPDVRYDADAGPARDARPGSGVLPEAGPKLPVRQQRQHARADAGAVTAPAGGGEFGMPGSRRTSVPGGEPTLAMLASMGSGNDGSPPPVQADDDPLTSPSFPRIAADDSRSYRRGRPEARGQDARMPDGPVQVGPGHAGPPQARFAGGYQAAQNGNSAVGLEGTGQRGATSRGGYPGPAGNGLDYAAAPAADPYRSVPSASPGQGGYPLPVHSVDTVGYQVAGTGSYPVPAAGSGGYPAVGSGGYPAQISGSLADYPADAATSTYSAPKAAANGYLGGAAGGYPAPAGASYPAQTAGQGGYPATGQDGYQAQPALSGYPAPAANRYPASSVSGTYPAGRPAGPIPAEPSPGYPNYGPGELAGSGASPYPQSPDPSRMYSGGSHGLAPIPDSEPAGGYPGFPAGPAGQFAVAPATAYSTPAPQLPVLPPGNAAFGAGYPAASEHAAGADGYPAEQFRADPYEPAGYPAPVHEASGYAASDPYALDPYGYPGYRNSGL